MKKMKPDMWSVFLLVPTGRAAMDAMPAAEAVEAVWKKLSRISHEAVSYTHLDVYKRQDDVLVERFSLGAGFLGAVQHGAFPDRSGEGLDEFGGGEGAEQAHLQHAYLGVFPRCV